MIQKELSLIHRYSLLNMIFKIISLKDYEKMMYAEIINDFIWYWWIMLAEDRRQTDRYRKYYPSLTVWYILLLPNWFPKNSLGCSIRLSFQRVVQLSLHWFHRYQEFQNDNFESYCHQLQQKWVYMTKQDQDCCNW